MTSPKLNLKKSETFFEKTQSSFFEANQLSARIETSGKANVDIRNELEGLKDLMLKNLANNISLANLQDSKFGLDGSKGFDHMGDINRNLPVIDDQMEFDKIDETIELKNMSANMDTADYSLLQKMGENDQNTANLNYGTRSGGVTDRKYEGSLTPKKDKTIKITGNPQKS